ncbi:phage portal protein [Methylopila jiangsuensis]|uniref:phage portal protein n=1 Tax=Methylopila jiangsuensis TaxID=586230 RepID=UPI00286D41AF|nr:phage portal protein [Methylopila jiangsuensis]
MIEFLKFGTMTASGVEVSVERALKNTAMFRAVSLISCSMGMLPLNLIDDETKEKAKDHPLHRLIHDEPNGWQSAYDFRSLMQLRALVRGDAYALVVRSFDIRRGRKVIRQLVPLDPLRIRVKQRDDWSVVYEYTPPTGGMRVYAASDIFHLRGLSLDGLHGLSVVKQAAEAIGLALAAELAAARYFRNGSFVDSALKMPSGKRLSPDAFERLRESLAEKRGADNAGEHLILEEGLEFQELGKTARDAQLAEIRKLQVEEIGRATGVPRPLLMVDETSWGSGIEALGRFFVQFALNPWFTAWQQAIERVLLDSDEKGRFVARFNADALLRGSTKDQGEFFARALGSGGSPGFMKQNEIRAVMDLPRDDDPASDRLNPGTAAMAGGGDAAPEESTPGAADAPARKDDDDDED